MRRPIILQSVTNLLEAGDVFYHGTSAANAESIRNEKKFRPGQAGGMSTSPNNTFVFMAKTKRGANFFSSTNLRHNQGEVLKVRIPGKLWKASSKADNDMKAFSEAGDALEVPTIDGKYLDLPKIAAALRDKGYAGIQFRDRSAGYIHAVAALPDAIEID